MPLNATSRAPKPHEPIRLTRSPRGCTGHKNLIRPRSVPLWLCAIYLNDAVAAALGVAWIGGRVLYFLGYREAVVKRLPGFFVQLAACLLLFIGAIAGIIMHSPNG